MADPNNPWHIAAPSNGVLWVMHVRPGSLVRAGEEVCNIAIMKMEKALMAPRDGIVKRVLKTANYSKARKMVDVKMGELLVELAPPMAACSACGNEVSAEDFRFCPHCGAKRA